MYILEGDGASNTKEDKECCESEDEIHGYWVLLDNEISMLRIM